MTRQVAIFTALFLVSVLANAGTASAGVMILATVECQNRLEIKSDCTPVVPTSVDQSPIGAGSTHADGVSSAPSIVGVHHASLVCFTVAVEAFHLPPSPLWPDSPLDDLLKVPRG